MNAPLLHDFVERQVKAAAKTAMLMHFGSVLSAANALEAGLIKSREAGQLKRKACRNGKSGVTGAPSNQGSTQKVELAKLARDLRTAVASGPHVPRVSPLRSRDAREFSTRSMRADLDSEWVEWFRWEL